MDQCGCHCRDLLLVWFIPTETRGDKEIEKEAIKKETDNSARVKLPLQVMAVSSLRYLFPGS